MEPGEEGPRHSHDVGQEVFLVLDGECEFEIEGPPSLPVGSVVPLQRKRRLVLVIRGGGHGLMTALRAGATIGDTFEAVRPADAAPLQVREGLVGSLERPAPDRDGQRASRRERERDAAADADAGAGDERGAARELQFHGTQC